MLTRVMSKNYWDTLNAKEINSMRKYTLLIFFGLCSFAYAQEVKVEVDTTSIRIGEQFNFQISVNDTANVIIPKLENVKNIT